MRSTTPAVLTAALLLSACGKGGESVSMKNASVDQVAATQSNKLQPGEWETTIEVVSQETTGAPAGLPPMGKMPPTKVKVCITPEQASRPEVMFASKGMDQFKQSCTYDKFDMAGGTMSADMHCDLGANGPKVKTSITGTFSATDLSTTGKTEVSMPGGVTIKSETKTSARRIGECQPGDAQAGAPKTN